MGKIIADDQLRAKLNGFHDETEICDEKGRPLAFIVPPDEYLRFKYARARERHSEAEIEELRKQRSGRPLLDILRDLGAA